MLVFGPFDCLLIAFWPPQGLANCLRHSSGSKRPSKGKQVVRTNHGIADLRNSRGPRRLCTTLSAERVWGHGDRHAGTAMRKTHLPSHSSWPVQLKTKLRSSSRQTSIRTRGKNPFELEAQIRRHRGASAKTEGDALFLDEFPFRSRRIVASSLNGLLPQVRRVFASSSTDVWF